MMSGLKAFAKDTISWVFHLPMSQTNSRNIRFMLPPNLLAAALKLSVVATVSVGT